MKEKEHKEAFEVHKRTIFEWALDVQGLENSQRIIGLHASRGIVELLSEFLHQKKLISEGFQLNHRWFKSEKVMEKLPQFNSKEEIVKGLIKLENLCENLSYGKKKSSQEIEEVVSLFTKLEEKIKSAS